MINRMSSFTPMFLIAMPQLGDPNFKRSVVLMLHHDKEGALGLVVNDPISLKLGEFALSQKLDCHRNLANTQVFCGGPVEPYRGWILHSETELFEKQDVISGLYVSGSNDSLSALLKKGSQPFRLLLGYAGWGPAQLEREMEDGSWLTAPADSKYIFNLDPDDIWDGVLHDMGVNPANLAMGPGIQ